MSKLSEYYINTCKQHADSDKLFIKWNWGAFLFGAMWLCYRGMFLYGLVYFLILFLEVSINYLMIDYYLAIAAVAMHILLGMYGTSLFCNKYKEDILDQLNKSKIYLDCSGKKQQTNPSLAFIQESLVKLTDKPEQHLILNNGKEFIQTILPKIKNNEKLFHLEYLDSSKNILFESQSLQTLDQTLNLFKLFLFEDKSLATAISWIDSDIEINNTDTSSAKVVLKTRPILALLFYIILSNTLSVTEYLIQTTKELTFGLPLLKIIIIVKNKFTLNASNIEFESPSFRLVEKKIKTLEQGDEKFVVLEKDTGFIQTYLSSIVNGVRYYHVEYKLGSSKMINLAKDELTEQQTIKLFDKFYKSDQSFVKDAVWKEFEIVKDKLILKDGSVQQTVSKF